MDVTKWAVNWLKKEWKLKYQLNDETFLIFYELIVPISSISFCKTKTYHLLAHLKDFKQSLQTKIFM